MPCGAPSLRPLAQPGGTRQGGACASGSAASHTELSQPRGLVCAYAADFRHPRQLCGPASTLAAAAGHAQAPKLAALCSLRAPARPAASYAATALAAAVVLLACPGRERFGPTCNFAALAGPLLLVEVFGKGFIFFLQQLLNSGPSRESGLPVVLGCCGRTVQQSPSQAGAAMRSWHGLIILAVAQLALHARGGVETVLAQANVRTPPPARRVPDVLLGRAGASAGRQAL